MKVLVVSKMIRCNQCGRGLGEHYGHFIAVRNHGSQTRFYGPGVAVIDCRACGKGNKVKVDRRRLT